MKDSVFTKIIKGEIPCHKIYENDDVLAFLDIHPKTDGHTLVVPKKQVQFIWDLDEKTYLALMSAVKLVGAKIREIMDYPYVGEIVFGLDVPHAHVHVFPFTTKEEFGRRPDMRQAPDNDALASIAKKLTF
jgi:histidine triad (HIT) family protein